MNLTAIFILWAMVSLIFMPRLVMWVLKQQSSVERHLSKRLEDFHIFIGPGPVRWIIVAALLMAALLTLFVFRSLWVFPACAAAVLFGLFWLMRIRLHRRLKEIRYQLPGVIELVATSLRAGLSIRAALLQVARQSARPISQELAILERMQRIGIPLDSALGQWAKRLPIDEVGLLAFAIGVSAASGGNLSESLDRLASSFRQRLILEEKVDALTAQGRLQAWVMVALPFLLAMALSVIDPASMAPLWSSGRGHAVLGVIVALELLGLFWIRRLIRLDDGGSA